MHWRAYSLKRNQEVSICCDKLEKTQELVSKLLYGTAYPGSNPKLLCWVLRGKIENDFFTMKKQFNPTVM